MMGESDNVRERRGAGVSFSLRLRETSPQNLGRNRRWRYALRGDGSA
jgi:hypothetical protein